MKKALIFSIFLFMLIPALYLVAAEDDKEEYDEDLYGPEDPIIFNNPVPGVIFEHKNHTMDFGLDCGDCHDSPFEMMAGAAEENDDFTMEAMYDGEYCGACHDGSYAFAADTRCTACHIGVRGVARLTGEEEEEEKH